MLTTLQHRFFKAENDLRDSVSKGMEKVIQPLNTAVPIIAFCRETDNGYEVIVSSKWLPGKYFETILSELSL